MQDEIHYMMIGVRHEAVVDNSENALGQFENLVAVPLSQLVAYHGSGIKPEQIGNLISAAGLSVIGVGVN